MRESLLMDKRLLRRYTRNTEWRQITESLFANDGALLALTRDGTVKVATEYQAASAKFGLVVNILKTSTWS